MRLVALFFMACLYSAAVLAQPTAPTPTFQVLTVSDLVASVRSKQADDLAGSLTPVIVFVPGILGSKLKFKDYEFGRDPISARHLVFDPDHQTRPVPETLNEFVISGIASGPLRRFSRRDIYGESIDTLQRLIGGRAVEEFAYDWRADIDESAGELHKWLNNKNFGRRPVVFVAHSMGGLVLWRWLQKFRRTGADGPVVRQAVIVGSPLQGTCEAARLLIEGYRSTDQAPTYEVAATKMLFEEAHAALLTFPSVYQLLPKYSAGAPCLQFLASDGGADPQDHHLPDFWLGRKGGGFGLLVQDSRMWPALAKSAGLSPEIFEQRIRSAIAAGARFRSDFSSRAPTDIQVSFLASDDQEMLSAYNVTFDRSASWFTVVRDRRLPSLAGRGDGRVLSRSAFNLAASYAPNFSRHPIKGEHGELIKHPSFLAYMRSNITTLLAERDAVMVGVLLNADKFKEELKKKGIVIDPGLAAPRPTGDAISAQVRIAGFNAESIAPGANRPSQSLLMIGLGRHSGSDEAVLRYRSALIESAAVLESGVIPLRGIAVLRESRLALGEADVYKSSASKFEAVSGANKASWARSLRDLER